MGAAPARPESDHLLEFVDQALFLGLRATGQAAAMQLVWVYDGPVDMTQIRRFHQEFGYGLAGRLIEPSPLPFGRHRWVASLGPPAPLVVETTPRPRTALSDWIDEHSQRPIDPQHGPAWHVGVLPMTDGATAVSLVGSHCIADGGGALMTVFEAVQGARRDLGYPPPMSRTTRSAIIADLRNTVRDLPMVGRTLVTAARVLNRRRGEQVTSPRATTRPRVRDDVTVVVPVVSAIVPLAEWDARAAELGGNAHSMLAGVAARLAVRQGRELGDDGTVGLIVPVNDRTLTDTRANAVTLAHVRVDPTYVTKDLTETRGAIREALRVMRERPDETFELLALTPFVPKVAVRRSADLAFDFAAQPVSCSNVGDLPSDVARVDGTTADLVLLRGIDQHVTRRVLEERQGLLTVVSGRIAGMLTLTVVGYQPGDENTKDVLRERVTATLAEFGLAGDVV